MKEKGVSIIDIIFAVLFLSVVLAVSVTVLTTSSNKSDVASQRTVMTTLIVNEAELLNRPQHPINNHSLYYDKNGELVADKEADDSSDAEFRVDVISNKTDEGLYAVKVKAVHISTEFELEVNTKVMR